MLYIRLLKESLLFAFNALKVNKLRTFLSLLGITIGIFCIISVFAMADAIDRNFRESIGELGDNVIFIQKWPWTSGKDYPWWKYYNRPEPKLDELREIEKNCKTAKASTFLSFQRGTLKYDNNSIENSSVSFVSKDYADVFTVKLAKGRFLTQTDFNSAKNYCVIGNNIAENLFFNVEPIGKTIKVLGKKVIVIGVMVKKGEDIFQMGPSQDDQLILSTNYGRNFTDVENEELEPTLAIKANDGVSNAELINELRGIMRSLRKLKPIQEDDFALNETKLITQGFQQLYNTISIAGWIIGGFSILVGGFGIANIMFVSVRERINIIGIQKAIGAKNYFILFQFLFESIFLCVMGGIVGLIIVFILSLIASNFFEMDLLISKGNIIMGISVSIAIGIISGILPAHSASKMNPVDAIRAK